MRAARRPRYVVGGVLAALCLLPAAVLAQVTTDEVPRERTVPLKEQVEQQMASSRYHLGPVRLFPKIALIGPSYDNNVLGASGDDPKVTDWTVTASFGLGALLPLGKKVYLRGDAFPEYIWYSRLEDRRRWGGRYRGALYTFFNRLSFQGDYSSEVTPVYPNSEIQTQVLGKSDIFSGKVEVDISGPLSFYVGGDYLRYDYQPLGEPPPVIGDELSRLDRNESALRGGVRYQLNSYFDFGVGVEGTRADFPEQPTLADNESTGYLLAVHYNRPRLFVSLNGGYRVGKARNGSTFPEYSTGTGSGFMTYEVARPISVDLYGRRRITYGLFLDNPYYFETLGGVGANFRVGSRLTVRAFGEYGTNLYPVPVISDTGAIEREDKLTTYGGGIAIRVFRTLSVTATAQNTDYNSNLPGFDRSVFRVTSSIVLGTIFQ